MYERFYGLSELPFELTANPKYLFLTKAQREALSNLQYGLLSARSLTLLIGEAGTGKTTLIRAALESERCRHVRCIYLNNPVLRADDFMRLLALKFDLGAESGESKSLLLERLERLLRERHAAGETTALVIDEAQSLSVELLEEIRLLANIETPSAKLLPLVLAGQPELAARLEEPNLRQLKQRVTLRCELEPFDLADTAAYIASRIRTAGGEPSRVFSREAVTLIHQYSRGIPRTISVICDNALITGMALGSKRVTQAIVSEVCRDLHLGAIEQSSVSSGGGAKRMSRIDEALKISEGASGVAAPELDAIDAARLSPLTQYSFEDPERHAREPVRPAPLAVPVPVRGAAGRAGIDAVRRRRPPGASGHGTSSTVSLEQYRKLGAVLHEAQAQNQTKTVMITSALPHEGKTLTVVNLALTLTESYARRVLVIDADLRAPSLHTVFDIPNERGLSEALQDGTRALPLVDLSGRLSVMTAGNQDRPPWQA